MKTADSELDLAIMPDKPGEGPCDPCKTSPTQDPKPQYPELCFRGKHADLFRSKYGACAPGDEYTMTVRCRVKSSSDGESEYEKRVEMCVEAIIGDVVEEEASKSEDADKPPKPMDRKLEKRPAPSKIASAAY